MADRCTLPVRNEARFEPRSELLGGLLRVLATFAGPLRRHDADERQRYDALPAERAADLNGGGENFRIEQPRRRMRARGAFQNRAFACPPPRQQTDDDA